MESKHYSQGNCDESGAQSIGKKNKSIDALLPFAKNNINEGSYGYGQATDDLYGGVDVSFLREEFLRKPEVNSAFNRV